MRRWKPAVHPALVAGTVLLFALTQDSFYRVQLGTLAGIYALAAIGLTLLFGGAGQISLGQAAFMGIGAFVTAGLSVEHGVSPWIGAALGVAIATVVGVLVGWSALRLTGHYLALSTLALGLMFTEAMRTLFPDGWYGVPALTVLGYDLAEPRRFLLLVWTCVVLCLLAASLMVRSRFGRSLAALRDDPLAAASCGVDIARAKVVIFALAAAAGGLAGALFAVYQGSVTETPFSFGLSFNLMIMVVIGGLGSPLGAVLGAVFLVLVPEFGRDYEQYRLFSYGVILILVLALFPGGLASLGRLVRGLVPRARAAPQ
jgi:branched-chain amino acid transport system permease protein